MCTVIMYVYSNYVACGRFAVGYYFMLVVILLYVLIMLCVQQIFDMMNCGALTVVLKCQMKVSCYDVYKIQFFFSAGTRY